MTQQQDARLTLVQVSSGTQATSVAAATTVPGP